MRTWTRDDASVSDVVGSILLVGITVIMVTGLSIVVLAVDPPDQDRFTELSFSIGTGSSGWGDGDETIRLIHMGGEPWPRADARIRVSIDGVVSEFSGGTLEHGFADGILSIGETWYAEFVIEEDSDVAVDAIDPGRQSIVASAKLDPSAVLNISAPSAANPVYANAFTATKGSVSSFLSVRSATDNNSVATLTESALSDPDVYATDAAGSATDRLEATGAPDDSHAIIASNGDDLVTTGFAEGRGTITSVHVVVEARALGVLINDELDIFYDDGATHAIGSLSLTGSDVEYTFNITSDKSPWTWADIAGLDLEAQYDKVQSQDLVDFLVDAMYIRVGLSGDENEMDVRMDFPAPASGSSHDLEIRYAASGDTFHVEVWNGTVWHTRGSTLDQAGLTSWTYTLTDDEVTAAGGAPRIRFVDDTPNGPTNGELRLDFVRVRALA